VDWSTLITIGAAFGVGQALDNSGLVQRVAEGLVSIAGTLGPYGVLLAIYLATTIFTELITNNAAAALIFPFALASAAQIGASPRPFVLAVAFAASASFITPLGYQTNLMVQGPGGYRYGDFVRIGLPLNLLLLACAMVLIPMAWPF
jgi:di/tricarboxylate transporter